MSPNKANTRLTILQKMSMVLELATLTGTNFWQLWPPLFIEMVTFVGNGSPALKEMSSRKSKSHDTVLCLVHLLLIMLALGY